MKKSTRSNKDKTKVQFKYNDANQLVEKMQNGSLVAALTYDNYGKTQTETDAFGHTRNYAYNGDALSSIGVDGKQNVAFTHNMYGQLTNATYENGQSLDIDYSSFNRVEQMKWQQNGKTIDKYAYEYDTNGNIVKETTKDNTIGYEYDNINRLVKTSSTKQFEETYLYDAVGNRTEKTTNGVKTTYKYGVGNRLLEALTGSDKTTYAYDDCGRMTTETGKGFSRTYAYDGFNKLAQINNEKGIQQNVYDPFGQRIGLVENGQTTQFDYGTDGLLTESIDNAPERAYFGSNALKNQIDADGNNYYGIYNVHGDMTYLMSGAKQLNTYTYSPFGETLSIKEGIPNRFRYSGEAQDSLTGDYYLNTRFYDPSLGRFTQEDNFLGDGLNLYAYVGNNPVNYVDPSGMSGCDIMQLFGWKNATKATVSDEKKYTIIQDGKGRAVAAELQNWGKSVAAMPLDLESFGISYKTEIAPHTMLDMAGTADPSGILDFLSGSWYASEGDIENAAISYASMMPLGDVAKFKHIKPYISAIIFSKKTAMMAKMAEGQKAISLVCKSEAEVEAVAKKLNDFAKGGRQSLFDWKLIKGTQPVIEGTNVPRSFVINGLEVNGKNIWVGGNATKHIGEFVTSANKAGGGLLSESEIMKSFMNAAKLASKQTLKAGDNRLLLGNWEIGINGTTGVIYHALMK